MESSTQPDGVLRLLLPGDARHTFLEQYYLRLPYASPGGCEPLRDLGSWRTIDDILADPQADVIVGRGGRQIDARPTLAAQAQALLADGLTVGIRHADRHDLRLAKLASSLARELLAPVDVHIYATPADQPGFSWHYDAEEVFILQCQGCKEWELRKNTVNPWPLIERMPADMQHHREIMPVLRCRLEAGDWLYIPAGYWHRTQARAESISLSIGLLPATALDLFDFLRSRLLDSMLWRQRLPPGAADCAADPDQWEAMLRPLAAMLGDDLQSQIRQRELLEAFRQFRLQAIAKAAPHAPGRGTRAD